MGYSLDNFSLMALTISTGFVVDDAIVVIENITRYLEQGMTPMEAASEGASEIGFTVISISISLIAVFIPILLMGGIVGRLFREFAVTLSVAIAVSMVVSLTTTPMMCAQLLRAQREGAGTWRSIARQRTRFQWMHRRYDATLGVGAAPSAPHADGRVGDGRGEHLLVHHRAQGIFPRAGHRPHDGRDDRPTRTRRSRPCTKLLTEFVTSIVEAIPRSTT